MPRRFAEDTRVPVAQSRDEIEALCNKYGAISFGCFNEPGKAIIVFHAQDRRIRFDLPLETKGKNQAAIDKDNRRRWRALLLCIKAKLESVESGIETFDEAFLAHVVMPDGQTTVGAYSIPRIAAAYKGEPMQPLLPPPGK